MDLFARVACGLLEGRNDGGWITFLFLKNSDGRSGRIGISMEISETSLFFDLSPQQKNNMVSVHSQEWYERYLKSCYFPYCSFYEWDEFLRGAQHVKQTPSYSGSYDVDLSVTGEVKYIEAYKLPKLYADFYKHLLNTLKSSNLDIHMGNHTDDQLIRIQKIEMD